MLVYYQNNEFSTTTVRPFHSADGRYTCIFEGGLINERILRARLERTGIYMQSSRVEEVLLALYCFSGDHFVEILRGKFAFIIFDHEKKELVGARDRYGIKLLYYHFAESGIGLASDVAEFQLNKKATTDLNKDTLRHYFSCGYFPEEATYLKNIQHVPAGCLVKYDEADGLRFEPFTDMLVIEGAMEKAVDEQQFQQLIIESIQARISNQQMLGMIYTGGASEQVIMTTVKLAGCDIKLFMAEFNRKNSVDSALEPYLVRRQVSSSDYLESARAATRLIGLPLADPQMPVDYLLAELASKHVDVMLQANGADLLFGADQTFFDWARALGNKSIFSEKGKAELLLFEGATWHDLIADDLSQILDLGRRSIGETLEFNTRLKGSDTLKTEKMLAAYELEARYPFLDDKVLNVATFLTGSEKRLMSLLKQVFSSQISNFGLRTKTNPHKIPLSKWLRTDLYEDIKGLFWGDVAAQFFNQDVLMRMLEHHRLRVRDFSRRIWAVAIFIIWFEEVMNER